METSKVTPRRSRLGTVIPGGELFPSIRDSKGANVALGEFGGIVETLMGLPMDGNSIVLEFRFYAIRVIRTAKDGKRSFNAVMPHEEGQRNSWAVKTDGKKLAAALSKIRKSPNADDDTQVSIGFSAKAGKLSVGLSGSSDGDKMAAEAVKLADAKTDGTNTNLVGKYRVSDDAYKEISESLEDHPLEKGLLCLTADNELLGRSENGNGQVLAMPFEDFCLPWQAAPIMDSTAGHNTLVEVRSEGLVRMGRSVWRFDFFYDS